jgi:NAD(P)-dependent dehydrogenase (short-subunit alcohol dehydrogenase family)
MAEAIYPDLAGQTVLVTGGADGIGRAVVEHCAAQGMRTAFLDLDEAKGHALHEALRQAGREITFRAVDLRDLEATHAAVADLEAAWGPFAVLVNNAGHDERHAFEQVTPDYWDDRFAVNLRHMMFVAQAAVPGMRRRGGGSIINLGSTSWMQGAPGLIAYTTAKSAVIGFTRSLARELGPEGIRVNCVTPGWVMTTRQRTIWATPEKLAQAQERQSLKGEILPEDVAAMVLFLASHSARMCTGQNFIVDAGVV